MGKADLLVGHVGGNRIKKEPPGAEMREPPSGRGDSIRGDPEAGNASLEERGGVGMLTRLPGGCSACVLSCC